MLDWRNSAVRVFLRYHQIRFVCFFVKEFFKSVLFLEVIYSGTLEQFKKLLEDREHIVLLF